MQGFESLFRRVDNLPSVTGRVLLMKFKSKSASLPDTVFSVNKSAGVSPLKTDKKVTADYNPVNPGEPCIQIHFRLFPRT